MHRSRLAVFCAAVAFSLGAATAHGEPDIASAGGRSARVVNGVVVQDRPTTGALLRTTGINHHLTCSGTLIGCQTFLTAAHCVCNDSPFAACGSPVPSRFSVFLQDVGIVGVASIHVDPTFSFGSHGDVAVLTLSAPITGVVPTPINTTARPPFGTTVEIAGYGLTRGGADDTGMLRRGLAETSTCIAADPDYHVCWAFGAPVGAPGLDSDTCNGDSGGPLFADLGAGNTVVGLTSGGTSSECQPTDSSYDTDVYVHRAYIQGIGGADLASTSCGSISQVGEPGTVRSTFDFDTLGSGQQRCRREFSKEYNSYLIAALKASQSCLDGVADGSRNGPCPDAEATTDLSTAAAKVSYDKLRSKCPDDIAPTIEASGACSSATTSTDLHDCILSAADTAIADALRSEYADDDPVVPMGNAAARECQNAVGKATVALLRSSLNAATRCQTSLASGKVASCPDAKTAANIAKAEDKATGRIRGMCSDSAIGILDAAGIFGGTCAGIATAAGLAACEIADHATIRDNLLALLADQTMESDVSFTVAPGTALLRVTLNGRDSGTNDLDLYIRAALPATTAHHDDLSENGGVFEETEVASPAAGTWYAHIQRYSGDMLIPYQLTATTFQP